ncbi:hypothetical protein [Kocuria sp.]|uniref:hypothetical protein n=1 Tax=Kocuria sp. TaxID=1871328 RepID=UPI0026DAC148|nr:hypothetical protein [Kocuria sp.]MDO4919944.1 hypothetical protein [Kocuria sp.]
MGKQFKLNRKGLEALRKQPRVREDLMRRARAVAAAAGGEDKGYKVTDLVLESPRAAVSVMATGHAHHENRKRNTLVKGLDAGRG